MLSEEQIVSNWDKYQDLVSSLFGVRASSAQKLLDHFGDRLVMCPASSRVGYHSCFVGGLIDHSMRVHNNCRRLAKVAPDLFGSLTDESIAVAALMHDIGKVGDLTEDRYLAQTSDYYRSRGNLYEVNQRLAVQPIAKASLWLLQHFDLKLSHDEWLAVSHVNEPVRGDAEPGSLPPLATLIETADKLSCEQEKLKQ